MLVAELVGTVVGDPSAGYGLSASVHALVSRSDQAKARSHAVVELGPLEQFGRTCREVQRYGAWSASHLPIHDEGRHTDRLRQKGPFGVEHEHSTTDGQRCGALGKLFQPPLLFSLTTRQGRGESNMI